MGTCTSKKTKVKYDRPSKDTAITTDTEFEGRPSEMVEDGPYSYYFPMKIQNGITEQNKYADVYEALYHSIKLSPPKEIAS